MSSLLECRNVEVYYDEHCALQLRDLTIPKHQSCAILGANGSGKSTLLKLLNQQVYPAIKEDYHFSLLGRQLWNSFELRKQVGFVSNETQYRFIDDRASAENVVISGYFASNMVREFNSVSEQNRQAARQILQQLEAVGFADKSYGSLSTGQQRRILLARALVYQPHTLILDEPTSGLDVKTSALFLDLLEKLSGQDLAIILVTHHVEEILPNIQRIILLKEGQVIADGNKQLTLTGQRLTQAFDFSVEVQHHRDWYRLSRNSNSGVSPITI